MFSRTSGTRCRRRVDGKFARMSNSVRNTEGVQPCDSPVLNSSMSVLKHAAERILADLPNDLARLIYLASIRDYNSGIYLQTELSRRYGVSLVDDILRIHHKRVFQNLLEMPVCAYVDQLGLYISFAGASRAELIKTWKDLEAYNSAIPFQCDKLAAEVFRLNVVSALSILERAT